MIIVCRGEDCGFVNFGWFDFKYMFFFGLYMDLDYMGFGFLWVINED